MKIGTREIGPGEPCYIIAEIGCNHGGNRAVALRMVDEAARCGADAVKFQTFDVDLLTSDPAERDRLWPLQLSGDDHRAIFKRCRERGVEFLSTPFDASAAEFLVGLGARALKIPSGEITNLPLIRKCASLDVPLIVSTGMAGPCDIRTAFDAMYNNGAREIAFLYCVSCYPTRIDDANLRGVDTLRYARNYYDGCTKPPVVGYSDHTPAVAVGVAAAVRGAAILEKHFTLNPKVGVDAATSLNPRSFKMMVEMIRDAERGLYGRDGFLGCAPCEEECRARSRRSWAAARFIPPGHVLEEDDLCLLRPGTGIPPTEELVGRRTGPPVRGGDLLTLGDLA